MQSTFPYRQDFKVHMGFDNCSIGEENKRTSLLEAYDQPVHVSISLASSQTPKQIESMQLYLQ